MIAVDTRSTDRVIGFHITGRITREDYRWFLPRLEEAIEKYGKISVLVHFEPGSGGFEAGALWDEIKFDLKHFRHVDRVAVVGDKWWHERSIGLATHLTPANGAYFTNAELDDAWEWILTDSANDEPIESRAHEIRRVLFATDFSDAAGSAMQSAVRIAAAHDASLTLLHATTRLRGTNLPVELQQQIDQSLEMLGGIAGDAGVTTISLVREGAPWRVICGVSREHDLIVIGARGHTPFAHPLGSTADRVLRVAPVPVLIVREGRELRDGMPRRILVPTDFSGTAALALGAVTNMFGSGSAPLEITLLHAWQPIALYQYGFASAPIEVPPDVSEQHARESLDTLAADLRDRGLQVATVVRAGYASKVITEEAEATDPDLVAIGTHGRSGLQRYMMGSIAERVVHHTHCPILSVGAAARDQVAPETVLRTTHESPAS